MEARNRKLEEWYGKINRSEIKLPRFQRFEAWDRHRICSLNEMVIHNLPLGITLVLEVGEQEKFISRFLNTSPEKDGRVFEHLLDGQQRLTALCEPFTIITRTRPTLFISRNSTDTRETQIAKTFPCFAEAATMIRDVIVILSGVIVHLNALSEA